MKRITAMLILLSFSALAVFGFAIMTHTMTSQTSFGCFAGLVGGEDCPATGVDVAFHHIAAYQLFSSSPVPLGFAFLGIIVFALLLSSWPYPLFGYSPDGRSVVRFRHKHRQSYFSSISVFVRWLALLEFSPAI